MQIWTFSKHHIFKYYFWEKTRYSNTNIWCFFVTSAKDYSISIFSRNFNSTNDSKVYTCFLHIRRILFAFQIDLRPQQHWWLEEQGRQVPWILMENSQANNNSEKHKRNHVSQSQDDGRSQPMHCGGCVILIPREVVRSWSKEINMSSTCEVI